MQMQDIKTYSHILSLRFDTMADMIQAVDAARLLLSMGKLNDRQFSEVVQSIICTSAKANIPSPSQSMVKLVLYSSSLLSTNSATRS
jgi:hypothetical protein